MVALLLDIEKTMRVTFKTSFSALYSGMKFFLSGSGGGHVNFYHQQLLKAVRDRYFAQDGEAFERSVHTILFNFFLQRIDPDKDFSFKGTYERGV